MAIKSKKASAKTTKTSKTSAGKRSLSKGTPAAESQTPTTPKKRTGKVKH